MKSEGSLLQELEIIPWRLKRQLVDVKSLAALNWFNLDLNLINSDLLAANKNPELLVVAEISVTSNLELLQKIIAALKIAPDSLLIANISNSPETPYSTLKTTILEKANKILAFGDLAAAILLPEAKYLCGYKGEILINNKPAIITYGLQAMLNNPKLKLLVWQHLASLRGHL